MRRWIGRAGHTSSRSVRPRCVKSWLTTARRKLAAKRGAGRTRISLDERLTVSVDRDEDVLDLDEALRQLADVSERRARIVEMRFFAGMNLKEIASVLGVSHNTVKREWASASSWLRAALQQDSR